MATYLSPKELARSIGVSESSVKRWVDDGLIEATRTAGGHRRIALSEVIRFVRDSDAEIVHPEILGMPELKAAKSGSHLHDYLVAGAAPETQGTILSLYLEGTPLETIFDQDLAEAMHRIGEMWIDREDGVFIEHRAHALCVQAIMQLRANLPPGTGPRAVGGAIADDIYTLPSLMVAVLLESLGFQVTNLGADTPFSALDRCLEAEPASLVWLSASRVENPEETSKEFARFLHSESLGNARVILGGREQDRIALPKPNDVLRFGSLSELSAFARGMLNA